MTQLRIARRIVCVSLFAAMASGVPWPAPAPAQAPGLRLVLTLNQPIVGPGATLEVTLGVEHVGPRVVVDLLFGAILPDGDSVVAFEGAGLFPRMGRRSQVASLTPMVRGVGLGDGTTVVVPDVLRYTWQGHEPLGTYRMFFAATRPNALRDGRLDGGDLIAVQTVTFTAQLPASVTVDPARSSSAQVSINGGTVAATAADGTTYRLTVPAGALSGPTTITLTPVTAVTGLPGSLTLLAAVRAEPDGLTLAVPATLTIARPGGSAPAGVIGFVTTSNGAGLELLPAFTAGTGELLVAGVGHFSVVGAAVPASVAALRSAFPPSFFNSVFFNLADTLDVFETHYRQTIAPLLVSGQTNTTALFKGMSQFAQWDAKRVGEVREGVALRTFPGLRGLSEAGKGLIATGLRNAIERFNAECAANRDFLRAEDVLRLQALAESYFQELTFATFAQPPEPLFTGLQGLDLPSVVANLCVRVDILAVEFPTDLQPGVVAPLTVRAGLVFTGGGPPSFVFPLDVDVNAVGASPAVRVGATGPPDGRFTTTFTPSTTGVTLHIVATFRPSGFPYLRRAALTDTETVGGVGGVIVSPSQTTINPGQSRQFTATVEGTPNQAVTWSVSGGGSITQTGLFTSNGTLGTFFVTATSVADSSAVGIAQVSVVALPPQPCETEVCEFAGTWDVCQPGVGCTRITTVEEIGLAFSNAVITPGRGQLAFFCEFDNQDPDNPSIVTRNTTVALQESSTGSFTGQASGGCVTASSVTVGLSASGLAIFMDGISRIAPQASLENDVSGFGLTLRFSGSRVP